MADFFDADFFGADAAGSSRGRRPADEAPGLSGAAGGPRPAAQPVLTVTAVCRSWSASLQRNFPPAWVGGEIASFMRAASGHCYFELKDASAQLRCVMFRGSAAGLAFRPQPGDRVEVYGAPSIYAARGNLQLQVTRMRRAGLGELYEQFLRLRERLAREGLFEASLKRPLPFMPATIGIVSSLAAAGLRDVLKTLERRAPYASIILYPAAVQGRGASAEIVQALGEAGRRREADVLLLVRGGGSFEDLACFNTEEVARAVRSCPIPVVTGIGHEVDTTLADLAADLRTATPTAAAERCAADAGVLSGQLRQLASRLRAAAENGLNVRYQRLDGASARLRPPGFYLRQRRERLERLAERARSIASERLQSEALRLSELRNAAGRGLKDQASARAQGLERLRGRLLVCGRSIAADRAERLQGLELRLARVKPRTAGRQARLTQAEARLRLRLSGGFEQRRRRFEALEARFLAMDFLKVLGRGFAVVVSEGGAVKSAASLKAGGKIRLIFRDGEAWATVDGVRLGEGLRMMTGNGRGEPGS